MQERNVAVSIKLLPPKKVPCRFIALVQGQLKQIFVLVLVLLRGLSRVHPRKNESKEFIMTSDNSVVEVLPEYFRGIAVEISQKLLESYIDPVIIVAACLGKLCQPYPEVLKQFGFP